MNCGTIEGMLDTSRYIPSQRRDYGKEPVYYLLTPWIAPEHWLEGQWEEQSFLFKQTSNHGGLQFQLTLLSYHLLSQPR
jgi:hypothetical protein